MIEIEKPELSVWTKTGRSLRRFGSSPWNGVADNAGNALRRILLSSSWRRGGRKIEGVLHEFSYIPHVLEDTPDIILNLKKLRMKIHSQEPQILIIDAQGEGESGRRHQTPAAWRSNPDLLIATLEEERLYRITASVGRLRQRAQ